MYNIADVCVLPSLDEGFAFPVLESMACGTRVVCTNATSLPELVGDAGLVFENRLASAEHLAATITQLLS